MSSIAKSGSWNCSNTLEKSAKTYTCAPRLVAMRMPSVSGPLTEGIRIATKRGAHVYVLALFSKVFEQFQDPLFAIEDIYAAYDDFTMRTRKLEQIAGVTVIE